MVVVAVAYIVGAWAVISFFSSEQDANPRSSDLRMLGFAVFWMLLTVWIAQVHKNKWWLMLFMVWIPVALMPGYHLARS